MLKFMWYLAIGGALQAVSSSSRRRMVPSCHANSPHSRASAWLKRSDTSSIRSHRIPVLWQAGNGRIPSAHQHMNSNDSTCPEDVLLMRERTMEAEKRAAEEATPHPLRMQDWRLEVRVRPWKQQEQDVTFHRNGTVWTGKGDTGDWWFDVGGLYWDVNTTIRAQPTVLHHKAELHWNVFGPVPRMFRGTVTRDRLPRSFLPPWFLRPVVGSFAGSGVGEDTADTSYRHRQRDGSGIDNDMPPRVTPQTDRY